MGQGLLQLFSAMMEEEKKKRSKCQYNDVFKRSKWNTKSDPPWERTAVHYKGNDHPWGSVLVFLHQDNSRRHLLCFPARTQLPPCCLQRQWKDSPCPLHGLCSSARLPGALHCPLDMEMWQVQPPKSLLDCFQVIVRSHWQQTSRLIFLVQRQNI